MQIPHGDNMETTWGQHEDNVETTWGPQGCGDHMGTMWRQCWDNMGTTGMWRPCGDNMETILGQHEDIKFTLKPPYSITHGKLRLAIWDTSFWTFLLKFGHKGP